MDYYLLHKDEDEMLTIGTDNGFGVFWADQGMEALLQIIEKNPDMVLDVRIRTDKNELLNVGEFLERIEKLKVRVR